MAKPVQISSTEHFDRVLRSSKIVVADFYADWCGPCVQIAPIYEQLSTKLSRPDKITFVKVNNDNQKELAERYTVTALPTFMIFKNKEVVETIRGADTRRLSTAINKLASEAEGGANGFSSGSGSSGGVWSAFALPKGYTDVTEQVEVKGLDLLNSDSEHGGARALFNTSKPSSLGDGKGKGVDGASQKDWVESDTDEQMMLFVPFMSIMKIHSLHITSLPPKADAGNVNDEVPMRPKTIKFYSNRAHVLGFDEAEDVAETQSITINPREWDEKTGTVKIELRFVKFQNVKSMVIFVVDGDGEGEKVRIDRIRFVGDSGEKRDQGKLEKIGDHE